MERENLKTVMRVGKKVLPFYLFTLFYFYLAVASSPTTGSAISRAP